MEGVMTLDEVIARESIRATLAEYTVSSDNLDAEKFCTLFAEDATFERNDFESLPGVKVTGHVEMRQMTAAWKNFPRAKCLLHNITTCRIEMTGKDTAKALTYFFTVSDNGPDHAGTYVDDMARKGDRWVFAHRRIVTQWASQTSIFFPPKK
jgi:hypothetical protein